MFSFHCSFLSTLINCPFIWHAQATYYFFICYSIIAYSNLLSALCLFMNNSILMPECNGIWEIFVNHFHHYSDDVTFTKSKLAQGTTTEIKSSCSQNKTVLSVTWAIWLGIFHVILSMKRTRIAWNSSLLVVNILLQGRIEEILLFVNKLLVNW